MPRTKPKQTAHDRRVTAAVRQRLREIVDTGHKAAQIEMLLAAADDKGESVRDVLSTLLVEVSNECEVYYYTRGVAGAFYQTAIHKAELMPDLSWAGKTALRHLDALLTTPNAKTAKALAKFWDPRTGSCSKGPQHDPFPEKKTGKR
jgi:hypothetical protein